MKQRVFKKWSSLLMALVMIMTILPLTALSSIRWGRTTVMADETPDVAVSEASNWMAGINDSMQLSEINIPGSHDAGAWKTEHIESQMYLAQTLNLERQFQAGVRLIDIRLDINDDEDGLTVYHGGGMMRDDDGEELDFSRVLNYCTDFLDEHSTETIILMYNDESLSGRSRSNTDDDDVVEWYEFFDNYTKNLISDGKIIVWDKDGVVPTMGEARGKIVLIDGRESNNDIKKWEDHDESSPADKVEYLKACFEKATEQKLSGSDKVDNDSEPPTPKIIFASTWLNDDDAIIDYLHMNPIEAGKKVNAELDKYSFKKGYNYGWILLNASNRTTCRNIYGANRLPDRTITEEDVTIAATEVVYNGEYQHPEITVKNSLGDVISSENYTVEWDNTLNVSTDTSLATATITLKEGGYYTGGPFTRTFKIVRQEIKDSYVTLEYTECEYDGNRKEPAVTVKDKDGKDFPKGKYTKSYSEVFDAGTSTVTINIIDPNYSGTITKTYEIKKQAIDKDLVKLSRTEYTYDGEEKKPDVTVKTAQDKTLTAGSDYTVEYKDNIEAGTATAVVTITHKNYSGTIEKTFTINPEYIYESNATLSQTEYTYSGKACEPSVKIVDAKGNVLKDTDYEVTYKDNIEYGIAKAKIKITNSSFKGEFEKSFVIRAQTLDENNVTLSQSEYVYDGNEKEPEVKVTDAQGRTLDSSEYEVVYSDNVNAGTAQAVVTINNGNYKGKITKSFTIKPQPIAAASVSLGQTEYVYDGTAKKPAVKVVDAQGNTLKAADYSVVYSNNTKAGTASAVVTVTNSNYSGEITKKFTIKKASATASVSKTGYVYNGKVKKPTVTVKDSNGKKIATSNYTVTYSNKNSKAVGKYTVKVTLKGNYSGTKTFSYIINPKTVTDFKVVSGKGAFTVGLLDPATKTMGYQVQYAANSKFTDAKTVKASNVGAITVSVSKLKSDKKYYVRVRTYNTVSGTKYYSAWSKTKTVTTK